jgi:hypothetical protein
VVAQMVYAALWSLDIWSLLLAVLFLGIRWLQAPNRVLTYVQGSVLPFYVLHHPFVLVVASFVVSLSSDSSRYPGRLTSRHLGSESHGLEPRCRIAKRTKRPYST